LQVTQPFKYQIEKKQIKLEIISELNLKDYEILCDWGKYKLILFNFV